MSENIKLEVSTRDDGGVQYFLKDEQNLLAYGAISQYPGLPNVGISHSAGAVISGKGHGSTLHQMRLNHVKHFLNLGYLICSVNTDNVAQIKIMNKFGWKELDRFFNQCTCNHVILFGKKVWND